MSARVRPRLERLERDTGTEEVWVLDLTDLDGEPATYQRMPVTEHGERLTPEAFEQLPPNPRRILIVIQHHEGEGEP